MTVKLCVKKYFISQDRIDGIVRMMWSKILHTHSKEYSGIELEFNMLFVMVCIILSKGNILFSVSALKDFMIFYRFPVFHSLML